MALTIWDQNLGTSRDATQADIDIMQAKIIAFGQLTAEWRTIEADLLSTIGGIHLRYRRSAEFSGDL